MLLVPKYYANGHLTDTLTCNKEPHFSLYPTKTSKMVRVTARQAQVRTRAKTRKFQERDDRAQILNRAREKYLHQLSILGVAFRAHNDKKPLINNNTSRTKKPPTPNHKITDYYSVRSRGRENVPQTPPQVGRNQRHSTGKITSASNGSTDGKWPLVITLGDTDDESETDIESDIPDSPRSETNDENEEYVQSNPSTIETETPARNLTQRSIESPFSDPNFSIRLDEDLEIVDMLPPIALRDHPVFDLEEEEE